MNYAYEKNDFSKMIENCILLNNFEKLGESLHFHETIQDSRVLYKYLITL
jgi:hypothetical protein